MQRIRAAGAVRRVVLSAGAGVGLLLTGCTDRQNRGVGYMLAPKGTLGFHNGGCAPVLCPQTITFGPLADHTLGDPPFTVSATASNADNLPVTFTASGNCTISGNTVTITGIGSCTITADQAGDIVFAPAPSVSQTFAITGRVPTSKDDCKDDGWQSLTRADGSFFKNQGACIKYVNTGE
jgi:hypothetical protein